MPFVMPRSGQKGFCRFVRRISSFSTAIVASPDSGILMRGTCLTTKVAKKLNHEGHEGREDDKNLHDTRMPSPCRLMQGRRVRVGAFRVVAIRIFPCIEQETNDLNVPVLRCQSERSMP